MKWLWPLLRLYLYSTIYLEKLRETTETSVKIAYVLPGNQSQEPWNMRHKHKIFNYNIQFLFEGIILTIAWRHWWKSWKPWGSHSLVHYGAGMLAAWLIISGLRVTPETSWLQSWNADHSTAIFRLYFKILFWWLPVDTDVNLRIADL